MVDDGTSDANDQAFRKLPEITDLRVGLGIAEFVEGFVESIQPNGKKIGRSDFDKHSG